MLQAHNWQDMHFVHVHNWRQLVCISLHVPNWWQKACVPLHVLLWCPTCVSDGCTVMQPRAGDEERQCASALPACAELPWSTMRPQDDITADVRVPGSHYPRVNVAILTISCIIFDCAVRVSSRSKEFMWICTSVVEKYVSVDTV